MEGIDDILAEVSNDRGPGGHSRRAGDGGDDDGYAYDRSLAPETRDLQALTRAWMAERAAPELRPYPHTLMERVMGRIRRQIEIVEMETGNVADPKANFRLIVLQTELERFKYLVRSFLRARIAKIDKYPLHLLSTPAQQARLAAPELQYLQQHQALLHRHFLAAFLGDFPAPLRRLDDTAGGISMLDRPDLDTAVFVRVLRDGSSGGGGGRAPHGGQRTQRQQGRAGLDAAMMDDGYEDDLTAAGGRGEEGSGGFLKRGDICVLRYSAVQEALQKGDVELI